MQHDLFSSLDSFSPANGAAASLLVRDAVGLYRPAEACEVLLAAQCLLASQVRGSDAMTSPAVVKEFLRTRLGEQEDVEVSAVHVATGEQPCFGFSIRAAARGAITRPRMAGELPRSVEQLSQLVGRVSLKELVRETTELVERLCIEAALELTGNNRASAAEVLGVSRQSLYSKLHRYGLGDLASAD